MTVEGKILINGHDRRAQKWLYCTGSASLLFLLAGTILYPDAFSSPGIHAGPIRLSPMAILFFISAPSIILLTADNIRKLSFRTLDVFLLSALLFFTVRGSLATSQANELGIILAYMAYTIVIYYGVAVLGQKLKFLRMVFLSLTLIGIAVASYALIEFTLRENIIFSGVIDPERVPHPGRTYYRSSSTMGHPVALGLFLAQIFPFLLYFYYEADSLKKRAGWIIAACIIALAIEVTFSKGDWAAVLILGAIAFIWYIWRTPKGRKQMWFLLGALVISLGIFSLFFLNEVQSGVLSKSRQRESTMSRKYMWTNAPQALLNNPWFGVGRGQGSIEIMQIDPEGWNEKYGKTPRAIDNLFLSSLVEEGIVGTIIAMMALICIFRQAWRLVRAGSPWSRWSLTLLFSMSAVLISGFMYNSLLIWPVMVIFCLSAGSVRALTEMNTRCKKS